MDHYLPHPSQDPSEDQSRSSGRWSQEEHHRFIEGLTQYGKNWKKVEDFIGTRSGAQIRSHAQKFFIRLTKEFKKRIDRDNNPNKGNRQRSNSVLSNFSHFSLGNTRL